MKRRKYVRKRSNSVQFKLLEGMLTSYCLGMYFVFMLDDEPKSSNTAVKNENKSYRNDIIYHLSLWCGFKR